MSFTDQETTYLRSQPLGRLATTSEDGQPDVVPVGFDFDGTYFYISGYGDTLKTKRVRNVLNGNAQVAFVVDDLVSTDPWTPRFLRVYGTADIVERDGYAGRKEYLRITPTISWSWNLGGRSYAGEGGRDQFETRVTRTVHDSPAQTRPADRQGAPRST
jgi:pyridoxamine 5'-phosphate oxidase family protein